MGTGDLCRVSPVPGAPQQQYATGEPGKVRGWTVWGCRRVLWVPDPRVQYSGKIRFVEKPWIQDYKGRHVAQRSSDPRVAYPEVKVQVQDLVRVMGIVVSCAQRGVSIRGKFVLSSHRS